jgi:glycosyltransferase involved in cell wall biosynthesis
MQIGNISFIVIARNEEFSINKCLDSIVSMGLHNCEVICVDSDSSDNTLEVMKSYTGKIENLQIIQISGNVNAATARNAGMQYATRDFIFFVDGDIELNSEFIKKALSKIESGLAECVTGGLDEIIYSENFSQIQSEKKPRRYYPNEKRIYDSGGTFITTRSIINKVGNWDERMVRNQDFDYVLRISRHGRLLAIPVVMGIHHTLSYTDRPWNHFKKGYPMIFGLLIRKNLDQPWRLKGILRNYRVGIGWWSGLFCALAVSIFSSAFSLPAITAIFGSFFLVDILWGHLRKKNLIASLFAHYLDPPLIVFGLFFEFKQKKADTQERVLI